MDSNLVWNVIDKFFEHDKYTLVSHQLESFNDLFSNGIKSGFLGVDSNASPYPTQDQPIDHKLTGAFTYTPTNIRNIRSGAERKVGNL